ILGHGPEELLHRSRLLQCPPRLHPDALLAKRRLSSYSWSCVALFPQQILPRAVRPDRGKSGNLLNGIGGLSKQASVTTVLTTQPGTTLEKRARLSTNA